MACGGRKRTHRKKTPPGWVSFSWGVLFILPLPKYAKKENSHRGELSFDKYIYINKHGSKHV